MKSKLTLISAMLAMAGMPTSMAFPTIRERKSYPSMVTSSPAEIAEHNEGVKTRQVMRSVYKPWKGAVQRDNWMAARSV